VGDGLPSRDRFVVGGQGQGKAHPYGSNREVVEFVVKEGVVVMPGALTPTEVITAWQAAADFVKVFPCAQVGGDTYIRALKAALPQVPLIASVGMSSARDVLWSEVRRD